MLIYSKINKDLFCIRIHFVGYVSKFEDDPPSQNRKYHRWRPLYPLSLSSALFSGFCNVEHFLFLFFRSSIFFMGGWWISKEAMIKRLKVRWKERQEEKQGWEGNPDKARSSEIKQKTRCNVIGHYLNKGDTLYLFVD